MVTTKKAKPRIQQQTNVRLRDGLRLKAVHVSYSPNKLTAKGSSSLIAAHLNSALSVTRQYRPMWKENTVKVGCRAQQVEH